jgi:inorganic pyrophosphatase
MGDELWSQWERLVTEHAIEIDRPKGTAHPRFPEMIYPLDYGYLEHTIGGDGAEIDIFIGSGELGLVGLLETDDEDKNDHETKLLWNCTDDEIETVLTFLNRSSMKASLRRRSALKSGEISNERYLANYAISVIPGIIELFMPRMPGTRSAGLSTTKSFQDWW